jgi:hypothetical protein
VIDLLTARSPGGSADTRIANGSLSKPLLPAPRRGERAVELGFLLGWHIAELFFLSPEPSSASDEANGVASYSNQPAFMTAMDDLSAPQQAQLLARKIHTESKALAAHISSVNPAADLGALTIDGSEALVAAAAQSSGPGTASFRKQVSEQDIGILLALQAADPSVGKSYVLARDLAAVMLNPANLTSRILGDQKRMSRLNAALEDLKSQYAQWAADAVRRNLVEWQKWADAAGKNADLETPPANVLLRQAEIWRAMLGGEKAPSDFLRPQDYLAANRKMLLEFTRELRAAITANRRVVAVVAVMTLVAVVAIGAAFATGINLFLGGAIFAMLGLVGVTGTRAMAKLRDLSQQLRSMLQVPALEAELMEGVAYATSRVPSLNVDEQPTSSPPGLVSPAFETSPVEMEHVANGKTPAPRLARKISFFGSRAAKRVAKTLILLTLVGAIVGVAASPDTRSTLSDRAVGSIRDVERHFLLGDYVPIGLVSAQGSSEAVGHQAQFLVPPGSGYWAADTSQDPQPAITLDFAQPTDVDYVVITSGAGWEFANMGRPRHVRVTYLPGGASEDLALYDDPKPTRYQLHGSQVSSARLQIRDVYPSSQSTLVALSELDFFRLK